MSLRKRFKKAEDSGVDMTPMLDIVFIMLIFFIVTATFLNERGLDFTSPQGTPGGTPTEPPIKVYVDAGNAVSVEGIRTDLANVPFAIETHIASKPKATVELTAHYASDLDPIVRIKDKMVGAGRKTVFKIVRD